MSLKHWGSVIVATLITLSPSFAQTITDTNANAWLMYFGDHAITSRWGIHLEGQARRADLGLTWQQLLLRTGANYQLNKYTMLTAGYAFVDSYPYGDYQSPATLPEHRFYEQVWIKHKPGRFPLQHRLRLEQRNIKVFDSQQPDQRRWELRQRFRYMFRGDVPLPKTDKVYLGFYDEFFIHFGANRGLRYLDQNRAYGAVGFKLNKFEKFEVGYLHQYVPQRNGRIVESNHTLQIALFSSRPFRQHHN
jgi:hypothetical protein